MAVDLSTMAHPRRVTIVTPQTRVDLALPQQATVAEVVVQVVALVGADEIDPDGAAGGWLLGRLGAVPLEPGQSVASTDISDGDVLYLSPRSARLPPALFDDVVDAVAEATSSRPDRWNARSTRRTAVSAAAGLAVAGAAVLATAGPPWRAPIVVAVVLAMLLLGSAALLSRAAGDAVAGAAAAFAAMPFAAWAAARSVASEQQILAADRTTLLVAGGALALAGVLGALAVADLLPTLGAAALTGAAAAVAGTAAVVFDASPRTVAAALAASVVLTLPAFPMLSVRLAGLPRPTVPTDMAEFRNEETPTPSDEMVDVARKGDAVLTGLLLAFVTTVTGCVAVLVASRHGWSLALAGSLSAVLVLRARHLLGEVQRLVLVLPGLCGLLAVAAAVLAGAETLWRLAAAPSAVLVGAALVAYASTLPRRGAAPYAARLVDVAEFLAISSLLPLAGAVLGAYSRIRGVGG